MNTLNSLKNTRTIYIAIMIIAVLLGSSIGLVTVSAQTSAFTVNSINDVIDINPGDGVCETSTSGECTLRAAIMEANTLSGDDTIILPAGNYVMTDQAPEETQFTISSNLIIQGEGRDITIIDANGLDRVFYISGQVDVTIVGITIQGGSRTSLSKDPTGGGIQTDENSTLTLTDCIIRDNTSGIDSTGYSSSGGGVYNNGTLTLNNSIVSNNKSLGEGYGGGITSAGVMIINNSSVTDNYAGFRGGGIFGGGTMTINDSIIQNNTNGSREPYINYGSGGGGGIWNGGILTLNSTNISNNLGSA